MEPQLFSKYFCRARALVLFCGLMDFGHYAWGQAEQNRQHVDLPPAFGGTPLSFQINAEASYVAAYGDMLESAAIARKINAEAVALEIQNSIAYVDAYFERRKRNREWRAEEDPNYLEREKKHQEVFKRRVEEQYQDVQRGDVTKTLNWLLRELANPVVAYQYLPANQTLRGSQVDRSLSHRDLEQVRLTDGGPKSSRLEFAAADGKAFKMRWPLGLRGPESQIARENYERTLDDVISEIKSSGRANHDNEMHLLNCANALFVSLENTYPKERRQIPSEFLTYAAAKRFLQSTLASTHRAITSSDALLLAGGLPFQGDTLIRLLEHMYRNGFEFASPEPGGEGVYNRLFQDMRTLYVTIGPNRPAVDLQPMAPQTDAPAGNLQDKQPGK